MAQFVPRPLPTPFALPTVLLIGTSMSAGKTTTGRVIVHELARAGLRVAGVKFTGAARYHDILSFADAGADCILDFVDAGLPSTVIDESVFRDAMSGLLARVAASGADVLVAEAGASPLEPYNGATAVQMLAPHVKFTVLCASDPYAVLGVMRAFSTRPDLVAGPAASTSAAIALVQQLTGVTALNMLDRRALEPLRERLARAFDIG